MSRANDLGISWVAKFVSKLLNLHQKQSRVDDPDPLQRVIIGDESCYHTKFYTNSLIPFLKYAKIEDDPKHGQTKQLSKIKKSNV